ncbi:uncharacterized protein LOC129274891 [Lytechinus pictus]|uniref:uncharacterized protein LOC129274891 n=1 Tax=Lytechinus pictus TaxID=7653 RepID=UPI0030BA1A9F
MVAFKLLVISAIWGAIAAWSGYRAAALSYTHERGWESLWFGFLAVATCCISILFLWILTLRPSPQQGVLSVLRQVYYAGTSYIRGKYHLWQIKAAWENPHYAQEQFLLRTLKENGDTDYGRKFKLKNFRSVEEFCKHHPLTAYEDYKPYVERVMTGERDVMTDVFPRAFNRTSGTTGPSKYFPQKNHRYSITRMLDITYTNLYNLCPRLRLLQKKLFHYVQPEIQITEGGGSMITIAVSVYEEDGLIDACHTTPPMGFCIQSMKEANYVHVLFALLDPNLGVIGSVFLGSIDAMMKQLENCWKDIIYDIEHGTINVKMRFNDVRIRSALEKALGNGQPERAGELRRQFMKGFDGIMRRVWPSLETLFAIDNTGIWPLFKAKYAEGITFVNYAYGNSEGMYLACSPWYYEDNRSMILFPNFAFYEFIRLEDSKESQPETLLIDELEVGQEYEIVLTQDSGIYRYRIGDVVRITGYYYNCPTFEFMYRMGLILNLRYEKMNQVVLKEGLRSAVGQLNGVILIDYAVAESTLIPKSSPAFEESEDMPYYVMFLELSMGGNRSKNDQAEFTNVDEIRALVDEELRARNSDYQELRRGGSISHPRVFIVKAGTFDDLKQYVVKNTTTSANQYKVPRRIHNVDALNFMYGHAIKIVPVQ